VNRDRLETALVEEFDAAPDAARVVGRQARDLADSGRIDGDLGFELTVDAVLDQLRDAPADHDAVERWNWWLGSLELSHGGYERFTVRPDDP
jgi:hypothetical protein